MYPAMLEEFRLDCCIATCRILSEVLECREAEPKMPAPARYTARCDAAGPVGNPKRLAMPRCVRAALVRSKAQGFSDNRRVPRRSGIDPRSFDWGFLSKDIIEIAEPCLGRSVDSGRQADGVRSGR